MSPYSCNYSFALVTLIYNYNIPVVFCQYVQSLSVHMKSIYDAKWYLKVQWLEVIIDFLEPSGKLLQTFELKMLFTYVVSNARDKRNQTERKNAQETVCFNNIFCLPVCGHHFARGKLNKPSTACSSILYVALVVKEKIHIYLRIQQVDRAA